MKLYYFPLLIAFFLCSYSYANNIANSYPGVVELNDSNFESQAFGNPGHYSFVYFYSPTCTHCKNLNPLFEPLAELFAGTKLNIFKVDGLNNRRIRREYNLVAFPVLKLFASNGDQVGFYKDTKDTSLMLQYLIDATGVHPNYPQSAVTHINETNFHDTIYNEENLDKDILLAVFDSNDPLWDDSYNSFYHRLAHYYRDNLKDPDVIFANIDVSNPTNEVFIRRQLHNITKVPTLFHFYRGRVSFDLCYLLKDTNLGPKEIVGTLVGTKEERHDNFSILAPPQHRDEL